MDADFNDFLDLDWIRSGNHFKFFGPGPDLVCVNAVVL